MWLVNVVRLALAPPSAVSHPLQVLKWACNEMKAADRVGVQ